MNLVGKILDLPVFQLDKSFAEKHQATLFELINLIPLVEYAPENILAEKNQKEFFMGNGHTALLF